MSRSPKKGRFPFSLKLIKQQCILLAFAIPPMNYVHLLVCPGITHSENENSNGYGYHTRVMKMALAATIRQSLQASPCESCVTRHVRA